MLRLSPDPDARAKLALPPEYVSGEEVILAVKPIRPARKESIDAKAVNHATTYVKRWRGKPNEDAEGLTNITLVPYVDQDERIMELTILTLIEAVESWSGIAGPEGGTVECSPQALRLFAQQFPAAAFWVVARIHDAETWAGACPFGDSENTPNGSETTQRLEPGA